MKLRVATLLFAAAAIAAPTAWSQDRNGDVTDMQALRAAVKADKRAFVASALNLTAAEGKKFWPVYDAYQRSLMSINRERNILVVDLVGTDKPLSEPYAKSLARDLITADEAEIKARRTMYNRVTKALSAKKAARYMQLEAKIRAVQAYDVAVAIPLVN